MKLWLIVEIVLNLDYLYLNNFLPKITFELRQLNLTEKESKEISIHTYEGLLYNYKEQLIKHGLNFTYSGNKFAVRKLCESKLERGYVYDIKIELSEMTDEQIKERDDHHTQFLLDEYNRKEGYNIKIKNQCDKIFEEFENELDSKLFIKNEDIITVV